MLLRFSGTERCHTMFDWYLSDLVDIYHPIIYLPVDFFTPENPLGYNIFCNEKCNANSFCLATCWVQCIYYRGWGRVRLVSVVLLVGLCGLQLFTQGVRAHFCVLNVNRKCSLILFALFEVIYQCGGSGEGYKKGFFQLQFN